MQAVKEFLKPTGYKIALFILFWVFVPYPTQFDIGLKSSIDIKGSSSWVLFPLIAPLSFVVTMIEIIGGVGFEPSKTLLFVLNMLVYPLFSYLLASSTVWLYSKVEKK